MFVGCSFVLPGSIFPFRCASSGFSMAIWELGPSFHGRTWHPPPRRGIRSLESLVEAATLPIACIRALPLGACLHQLGAGHHTSSHARHGAFASCELCWIARMAGIAVSGLVSQAGVWPDAALIGGRPDRIQEQLRASYSSTP